MAFGIPYTDPTKPAPIVPTPGQPVQLGPPTNTLGPPTVGSPQPPDYSIPHPDGWVWNGAAWVNPNPASATPSTPAPAAGGSGTGGGSSVGGLIQYAPFTAPSPVDLGGPAGIPYVPPTPKFTAPQLPKIPEFKAPSVADALADPGYLVREQRGEAGLQNWAAAQGTLNDSSTAKALIDYGQNSASQEYGNVWNRAYNAYQANLQSQYLDPFNAEYGGWLAGTVNPTMTGYSTQAAAGQYQTQADWQNAFNLWLQNNPNRYALTGQLAQGLSA